MKQVVDYANKNWWSWLYLWIKTIKNQNQLNELWKIKTKLSLYWIEKISNEQLKWLSNVERLSLNWLKKITLEQVKILANSKIKKLELESLRWECYRTNWWTSSITDEMANILNESDIEELYINPIRLTKKQRKILEYKLKW